MKKRWLLTLIPSTFLAYKKLQAKKESRSLRSKLVEDTVGTFIQFPDYTEEEHYQKALEDSKKEFELPESAKRKGFDYAEGYTNTLELLPSSGNPKRTIFYTHGGAYWFNPLAPHFDTLKQLAENTNARIVMPIYPKAPYYKAIDVYEFMTANYQTLLNELHDDTSNLFMMGDSAGGGFTLAFMQFLRDEKMPLPAKALLLSPWLDISHTNPDMPALQKNDALLNIEMLAFQGKEYAGDFDVKDPRVSPIYGDLTNLPTTYIFTGNHDILNADAMKIKRMAKEQNLDIHVFSYNKMPHTFSLLRIPEGEQSRQMMYQLIKS